MKQDNYLPLSGNEKIVKIVKSPEIFKIENKNKIDTSIFHKKSNSKTFDGFLIGKVKEASKNENKELVFILTEIYNKYKEFETSERIILKGWKGKSSMQIIEKPDYFTIITFQKEDKDSQPHEVKRDISKLEVNRIIKTISELNKGNKISTRDIGERAYKRRWNDIFSDRQLHTELNLILRLLDYYKMTKYRSRYSLVLNNIREIQEVLE